MAADQSKAGNISPPTKKELLVQSILSLCHQSKVQLYKFICHRDTLRTPPHFLILLHVNAKTKICHWQM